MKSFAIALCAACVVLQTALAAAAQPKVQSASAPAKLTELVRIDRSLGKGRVADSGDTVTIHYSGWLYAPKAKHQHGPQFDTSYDSEPYTFKLGAGAVIKGWEEGVRGMRAGGKRTLLVPASLGFGKEGLGPVPTGASLVFDIELISVK